MATTTERLDLQAAREASLVEKLNARFAFELGAVLRLANTRIRQLVRELQTVEQGTRAIATKANLGRVLGLRRDVLRALEQAGYQAAAEGATSAPIDQLTREVLRGNSIAQRAFDLTKTDLSAIAAFKTVRFDELLRVEADLATRIWRVVLDGTLGLRPVDELVDDVADAMDQSERQARTTYDTALSILSRQVDQLHATGAADELFYYAGPLDTKTRKFCRARVGKVFTREQLETADNGQLPNPLLTGGGYNCRHAPKRVSALDRELRELAGTGRRVAHVQQILDQLEADEARRKAA